MAITEADYNIRAFLDVPLSTHAEGVTAFNSTLDRLEVIDLCMREVIEYGTKIKPTLAGILLLNAHASFRAAIHLALTGQVPPVYMALRGALESAMYAALMVSEPKLADIWTARHQSDEARRRCKNAFGTGECRRALTKLQNKMFADMVEERYSATIDFGAHPNVKSVLSQVRLNQLEGGAREVELAYVNSPAALEVKRSLIACAEIAIFVTFIGLVCLPEGEKLTGLNDEVLAFQADLPNLIKGMGLQQFPELEAEEMAKVATVNR